MKISVLIPAYNAAATIDATINSVLAQTVAPDEILVLDDGSTDETCRHLAAYQSRVTIYRQSNHGVAHARNFLCQQAKGEIIAFLDADDIWHPQYLQTQCQQIERHPQAAVSFTGHVSFHGANGYAWEAPLPNNLLDVEVLDPMNFLKQYNSGSGNFGSWSYCCIPKQILIRLGREPFPVKIKVAEDLFLMNLLSHYGAVVYTGARLVAYRKTPGSLTSNRLESTQSVIMACELLAAALKEIPVGQEYEKLLKTVFAVRRRDYAKFLMSAGRASDARMQLKRSLKDANNFLALTKSMSLLLSTYLPPILQPRWPAIVRK